MDTYSNLHIDHYNRTALSSIDSVFSGIGIGAIAEPLLSVSDTVTIGNAASIMREHRFDVLGVTHDGMVTGYLSNQRDGLPLDAASLRPVTESIEDFSGSRVASSCSLWEGLSRLAHLQRLFLADSSSDKVTHIVTRADLQKAPVRMMVFAYITIFEIHLTERIRDFYPGDSWQSALESEVAASKPEVEDYNYRKAAGEEADLLDCLGFFRKEQIILSTGQLMSECTLPNKDPRVLLPKVRSLRNAVAHGSSLANKQRRWADVAKILANVRTLNARLEADDGEDAATSGEEMSTAPS